MRLRCANPDCESRQESDHPCDQGFFNVTLTVYSDGSLAENPERIEAGYFTCNMCGREAEEEVNEDLC